MGSGIIVGSLEMNFNGRNIGLAEYGMHPFIAGIKSKVLDHRVLGRGHGVRPQSTGSQSTGSWSRGKALDHRALGRSLGVRHWITEHWVVV